MQRIEEEIEPQLEEALAAVLGAVFKAVDWKKMRGRRSRLDIFEHRLSYAKYEPTVEQMYQRLCNALSLQAPEISLERMEFLREHDEEAMELVRRMDKLLTLEAAKWAGMY